MFAFGNVAVTIGAVIIFPCVLINRLTVRIGVPMLFLFILLGMVFGSDGLVKIPFEDHGGCGIAPARWPSL